MTEQNEWTIEGRDVFIERWSDGLLETITKEEAELRLNEYETLKKATEELIEVASLRGDNELPHPANDHLLWTARMQDAWDTLADILEGK